MARWGRMSLDFRAPMMVFSLPQSSIHVTDLKDGTQPCWTSSDTQALLARPLLVTLLPALCLGAAAEGP